MGRTSLRPNKTSQIQRLKQLLQIISRQSIEVAGAHETTDVASGKVHPDNYQRCVVAFEGNELSRGGGGARCITMPLVRQAVNWHYFFAVVLNLSIFVSSLFE